MRQILKPINSASSPQVNSFINESQCTNATMVQKIMTFSNVRIKTESDFSLAYQLRFNEQISIDDHSSNGSDTCHHRSKLNCINNNNNKNTNNNIKQQKENACSNCTIGRHDRTKLDGRTNGPMVWPSRCNQHCDSSDITKQYSKMNITNKSNSPLDDDEDGDGDGGGSDGDHVPYRLHLLLNLMLLVIHSSLNNIKRIVGKFSGFTPSLMVANMRTRMNDVYIELLNASSAICSMELVLYCVPPILVMICFANSLHGDFVHDDIPALVQNPDVLGTTSIRELFTHDFWGRPISDIESHKSYRPITTLTFRLNMMFSMHTFGFHLVNLVLHGTVCILVCRLLRILHFDSRMTLIATTLFATHPIHCEAVSSIVGRADVLCALFYLLAFFAFHESLQASTFTRSQLISLMACVFWSSMALLSKETGLTVLGVCAFYWFAVRFLPSIVLNRQMSVQRQHSMAAFIMPITTVIITFIVLLTLRLNILGGSLPFFSEQDNPAAFSDSLVTRILTYSYLAVFNIGLMISPEQQAYDWQTGSIQLVDSLTDARNVTTILFVLTLIALSYRIVVNIWTQINSNHTSPSPPSMTTMEQCKEMKPNVYSSSHAMFVSILFIILPYLPASNLFLTVGFVVAERLLYIPSIGFLCLICAGIEQMKQASHCRSKWQTWLERAVRLCQLVFTCLTIVFAFKTIQQNRVWSSRENLYKSGIMNVPENAKAHYNYANLQQDIGNFDDAMRHYHTAIRLWPQHASAHNNLGALFWRISKPDHAEQYFSTALQINPYHAKAHFNLAKVFGNRGQTWEAIILMERSIRLDKRFGESYEALATLYAQIGQVAIAERLHMRAIRLRPRNSDFHNNYGAFLQKTGRIEYAIHQYNRALQLRPTHRIALLNAANAFTIVGRYEQAELFYKRALRLKEDLVTLDSLGVLFIRQSKLNSARHVYKYIWNRHFSHVLKHKPTNEIRNARHTLMTGSRLFTTSNICIHYAQLLILEGHYQDAEVLLEALTRLEHNYWQMNQLSDETWPRLLSSSRQYRWKKLPLHCRIESYRDSKRNRTKCAKNQYGDLYSPMIERQSDKIGVDRVSHSRHGRQSPHLKRQHPSDIELDNEWGHKRTETPSPPSTSSTLCKHISNEICEEKANSPNEHGRNRLHSNGMDQSAANGHTTINMMRENGGRLARSGQLMASQTMLLLIDVHHQLALLYTLTNRTAEALDSISKALNLCTNMSKTSNHVVHNNHQIGSIDQSNHCAQVYTLQGDIHKDLYRWNDAIESYRQAIQLDHCLERPHLNLAVIYHLNERYMEAMQHYIHAQQLDTGKHYRLIHDNISKLRRQQIQIMNQDKSNFNNPQLSKNCELNNIGNPIQSDRQPYPIPNTTVDHTRRSSSFPESESNGSIFRLFSVHTSSRILSSL